MRDEDIIAAVESFFTEYPDIPKDKTYENVIALIKQHTRYYSKHATSSNPSWEFAKGSVDALNEILEHFDEPHEGHKSGCSGGIHCYSGCGLSKLRITRVETMAYYQCKCGHTWEDNEYPGVVYQQCPSCGATN